MTTKKPLSFGFFIGIKILFFKICMHCMHNKKNFFSTNFCREWAGIGTAVHQDLFTENYIIHMKITGKVDDCRKESKRSFTVG